MDKEALLDGSDKPKVQGAVSETKKEKLVLFGLVDLTDWPENSQAIVLAGGALLSSLGFAYLQEK